MSDKDDDTRGAIMTLAFFGVVALIAGAAYAASQFSPPLTPPPPPSNAAFFQLLADTGCHSLNSPTKKDDLFKSKYEGKRMMVSGKINGFLNDNRGIAIKILENTWISDVSVEIDPYDLQRDSYITVSFDISGPTDCILPLEGKNGRKELASTQVKQEQLLK